jgi:type IV pilus assembly protein PilB
MPRDRTFSRRSRIPDDMEQATPDLETVDNRSDTEFDGEESPADAAADAPAPAVASYRRLVLRLRDTRIVEGHFPAAGSQPLTVLLEHSRDTIDLTEAHIDGDEETLPYFGVAPDEVAWAQAPDGDIPLCGDSVPLRWRQVQLTLVGGPVLNCVLGLPEDVDFDDLPADEYVPVHEATPTGEPSLGDLLVCRGAVKTCREVRPSKIRRHWLHEVLRAASTPVPEDLIMPAGLPLSEAWSTVSDQCAVQPDDLAKLVAAHYRLRIADTSDTDPAVTQRIPEKIARRYHIFPLRERDEHLVVATADPTNHDAEQALRFTSRRAPIFEIAPPATITGLINARYSQGAVEELLSQDADKFDIAVVEETGPEAVADADAEAAPIIKLTNVILRDAVRDGVSDIHFEPLGHGQAMVRYRIDGVLRQYTRVPVQAHNRVLSRIKIMAEMDIADRLRPQDGRARITVDGKIVDLRVNTVPTRQSEKAVIRILKSEGDQRLADLKMPDWEQKRFLQLLGHREGIIVVTGPTGSGKTTTLYAALRELATGEVNVTSVEDPVEYELEGITQIQVDNTRGVTFAAALRAILRQDPDIVFVGEIRDHETAEIAVHASMTGHVVLATLHTNDAVGSIARFSHLGVDLPSIASTLRGALAQRLMRRTCSSCAEMVSGKLTAEETGLAQLFGVQPTVRARGCQRCNGIGYKGRVPVLEVMTIDEHMQELIIANASSNEIQAAAAARGMRSMLTVALDRVKAGQTTLQEVRRVIGGPEGDNGDD